MPQPVAPASDEEAVLDELKKRAEETPVATNEALALNREILRRDPGDVAAANRLGRGLQDAGRTHQALDVFEATLRRDPGNAVAMRRAEELRRLVS